MTKYLVWVENSLAGSNLGAGP